jgi:VanZ family protein
VNQQGEGEQAVPLGELVPEARERLRHLAIEFWFFTFLYCVFIFYLSSLEGETVEGSSASGFINWAGDKLQHVVLYAGLGCLLFISLRETRPLSPWLDSLLHRIDAAFEAVLEDQKFERLRGLAWGLFYLSFVLGFLYGFSDELHQHFVSGRKASVLDLLVNGVGVFLGSALSCLALGFRRYLRSKPME